MTSLRTLVAVGAIACAACSGKSQGATASGGAAPKGSGSRGKLTFPVDVAPLTTRHVSYAVAAPGTLDAFQMVQITARVAGAVDKVSFKEGEVVKPGQVLATIEVDRYNVALQQAKAALEKSKANEQNAEDQLARRQAASDQHPGLIAKEEIATFTTNVATTKADVAAATEALHVAQLNLRDSAVRAPIAGIVQTRTVQQGQYLQPGAVLATILQRDPMLLRFQVGEMDAPRLKPGNKVIFTLREAYDENKNLRNFTAQITLVAGAADPTTRLVPVTATVDPTEYQYWLRPGAFAEVSVPVENARPAIVVPAIAVQPTDHGNVVYVVTGAKPDPSGKGETGIAKEVAVDLGMHTPEGGVEVRRGLADGDLLVVHGIDGLTTGAPVKILTRTTVEAVEGIDGGAPPAPAGSGAPAPRHSGMAQGASSK